MDAVTVGDGHSRTFSDGNNFQLHRMPKVLYRLSPDAGCRVSDPGRLNPPGSKTPGRKRERRRTPLNTPHALAPVFELFQALKPYLFSTRNKWDNGTKKNPIYSIKTPLYHFTCVYLCYTYTPVCYSHYFPRGKKFCI